MDQDYISVTGSAGFGANANSVQDCPKHPVVSIPTLHFTFITLADVILIERGHLRACLSQPRGLSCIFLRKFCTSREMVLWKSSRINQGILQSASQILPLLLSCTVKSWFQKGLQDRLRLKMQTGASPLE